MTSRAGLRVAVAVAGLVPVGAGLAGVLLGPGMAGDGASGGASLDSHFRYLSGLLLGIGLAFWAMIPRIQRHGGAFRLLGAIVVAGGLGRLAGLASHGAPSVAMQLAVVMELGVTPLLCVWQWRVAMAGGSGESPQAGRR